MSGTGEGDEQVLADIVAALEDRDLEYTRPEGPNFVVTLPGEHKLKTTCLLTLGRHGLRVEAFVCRHPDEDFAGVYRYLLRRNRNLYGVAYTIDKSDDIYLIGRIERSAIGADEIDRVLGQVLEAADGDFNTILEIGFVTSIRREWRWRTVRGESRRNLEAFDHLVTEEDRAAAARGEVVLNGDKSGGSAPKSSGDVENPGSRELPE